MLPSKLRSPAKDGLQLVNEEKGSGTEMGTFMPTWVRPSSCDKSKKYDNQLKEEIN